MASKQDRNDPGAGAAAAGDDDFGVSEIAAPTAGAAAPFGNVEFPLPPEAVNYTHPTRRDRPNLAGD